MTRCLHVTLQSERCITIVITMGKGHSYDPLLPQAPQALHFRRPDGAPSADPSPFYECAHNGTSSRHPIPRACTFCAGTARSLFFLIVRFVSRRPGHAGVAPEQACLAPSAKTPPSSRIHTRRQTALTGRTASCQVNACRLRTLSPSGHQPQGRFCRVKISPRCAPDALLTTTMGLMPLYIACSGLDCDPTRQHDDASRQLDSSLAVCQNARHLSTGR